MEDVGCSTVAPVELPSCCPMLPSCAETPHPAGNAAAAAGSTITSSRRPRAAAAHGQQHPGEEGNSSCLPTQGTRDHPGWRQWDVGLVLGESSSSVPRNGPVPLKTKTFDSCIKPSRLLTFGTIPVSHHWSLAVKKNSGNVLSLPPEAVPVT